MDKPVHSLNGVSDADTLVYLYICSPQSGARSPDTERLSGQDSQPGTPEFPTDPDSSRLCVTGAGAAPSSGLGESNAGRIKW